MARELPMFPGGRSKPIRVSDLQNGNSQCHRLSNDFNNILSSDYNNTIVSLASSEDSSRLSSLDPKDNAPNTIIINIPAEDPRIGISDDEAMTSPLKRNKTPGDTSSPCDVTDSAQNNNNNVNNSDKPCCCGIHAYGGYNPILFFSIAYFSSAFMFLVAINLVVLPDLYYPTIGNLLPLHICHEDPSRVLALIVLWGMHYVRRFGEVLFIHVYRRGETLKDALGSIAYYSLFGLWVGWSINYHINYLTPPNYLFVPGILLCIVGEVGNCICHIQLRAMRKSRRRQNSNQYVHPISKHVIPKGGCFSLVTCPHYLFEVLTWLGFALAAFTLAAWTFFAVSLVVLMFYSCKKHSAIKKEFNGKDNAPLYPKNRKALVPFIF